MARLPGGDVLWPPVAFHHHPPPHPLARLSSIGAEGCAGTRGSQICNSGHPKTFKMYQFRSLKGVSGSGNNAACSEPYLQPVLGTVDNRDFSFDL